MKKLVIVWIIGSIVTLCSCSNSNESDADFNESNLTTELDSCLDFGIHRKPQTWDPSKMTDVTSFHVLSQIYEPLLRFNDSTLAIEPLLAESWSISEDQLVYTFKLKEGVYFHTNQTEAKELNANDVAYTFGRILTPSEGNYSYSLFKNTFKGSENSQNINESIQGINVIDENTISFTLIKPMFNFLSLMATVSAAIVNKDAIEQNIISGTGPFIYNKKNDTELALTLLKNNNYHVKDKNGASLPYLKAVAYNYIKKGENELTLFKEGKLDIISGIPTEAIKKIVESEISNFQSKPTKYILGSPPQILTSYLNINTAVKPFNKIKVRQAIGCAIDKVKLVNNVLKGEAYSEGSHGIVPPAIKGYDFSSVIGHEFNVDKAKRLLSEAGYPEGKDFPTIKFTTGKGKTSVRAALEIQKQLLRNLNVNIEISSLSHDKIMQLNNTSQTHMTLGGWLGEIPDPISFLSLCYGGNVPENIEKSSFPNESRYQNKRFDKLYEKAIITTNKKNRFELCLEADQIIATEVPLIPLWYHQNYQLIRGTVKNFKSNSMTIQYLVNVKIEAPSTNKKAE